MADGRIGSQELDTQTNDKIASIGDATTLGEVTVTDAVRKLQILSLWGGY